MTVAVDVSVIIINYNTKQKLSVCLDSVLKFTSDVSYEVIVVDNASSDGSVSMIQEKYPFVHLIQSKKNVGFGRANNMALKEATGKYVFYLNSDTELLNNAIKIFWDYWEKSKDDGSLGALGANLLTPEHTVTHSYGSFPTYHSLCMSQLHKNAIVLLKSILQLFQWDAFRIHVRNSQKAKTVYACKTGEVDYITGADLFLKNDDNAAFDSRFFMYCEETDLQYQLMQKGKKRIIIDGPKIIHNQGGGASTHLIVYRLMDAIKDFSCIEYAKKNLAANARILQGIIVLNQINPGVRKATKQAKAAIRNSMSDETTAEVS